MEPTILDGQVLTLQDYGSAGPQRGDIIAFHPPIAPSDLYVKRVIAIPGDTVAITQAGVVVVNGKHLVEPYVDPQNDKQPVQVSDYPVHAGEYFVLGDNRDNSTDSRYYGSVDRSSIVGKVVSIKG
jgi:signal peptidase I